MTFHWHVAALQGSETGPFSSEATFTTDYSGACGTPSAQEASLIGMACLEDERMMVVFEFPEPPQGTFIAMANGQNYDCQTLPGAPQRLFCIGEMLQEDILVPVQLEDQNSGALLFDGEISILCEQEQEEGDDLPACSALGEIACDARGDCYWTPYLTHFGGYCSPH